MAIYGTTADATTTSKGKLQLTGDLGGTAASPVLTLNMLCQGRLTLTSGTAVTTSDVTAAGTLYFTPYRGNKIGLYDGSKWAVYSFTEVSLTLTLTSGSVYDIFIYNNAGTLTLESLVWSTGTARATAITLQDGIYVKSGATTRRYLGTIKASGTNQTEDSAGGTTTNVGGKRYVWNYYNRVPRTMSVIDTTDNWSYTTDTIRQARATAGNQVDFVIGVSEDEATCDVWGVCGMASNSTRAAKVGVGLDSTSSFVGIRQGGFNTGASALWTQVQGHYRGFPGIGYHYFSWNEKGADGTSLFLGDNGADGQQLGLYASILG